MFYPYGLQRHVIQEKMLAEWKEKKAGDFDRKLTDLLSNKNKTVAWVVSNCQTASGRVRYTEELQKFIKVDIYGKCSQNPCPDIDCCKRLFKQ